MDSLNVTRHIRIHSIHFEGGLGPTKLNPVPSIFIFPQHLFGEKLRKVVQIPRSDVESSERKHHRPRGVRKCLSPEKKNTLTGLKEKYSAFEGAYTPYWQSVYVDAEVQTDLTASEIEVSSMASS